MKEMSYFESKTMTMNDPLKFQIIAIEGSDAQVNALFYLPEKTFDQSNSPEK